MKLKIELNLKGTTISGRVLEQDESLRSLKNEAVKTLIKNDNFEIRSSTCPQLFFDTLWVRGEQQLADNISFVESYDNPEDANKVYATIVELVNELNGELGGVVDEQGMALYIIPRGEEVVPVVHHGWSNPMTETKEDSNHMKIYISGKITGNANYTEEFAKAEKILKEKFPGATIINPADVSLPSMCDWYDYMTICLRLLSKATHIYMLDNWVQSRGACTEHLYALANDIKVLWSDNSPYRGA